MRVDDYEVHVTGWQIQACKAWTFCCGIFLKGSSYSRILRTEVLDRLKVPKLEVETMLACNVARQHHPTGDQNIFCSKQRIM